MSARVAALETLTADTKASLARIEANLRKGEVDFPELKGRVSQLPSTVRLIEFLLAVLALSRLLRFVAPH